MQKLILFVVFFCSASAMCQLDAQSINNKIWTTYIGNPINDTAIFHISSDSSFITNAKGEVVVRNRCKISGDTLTVMEYGSENQGCPDVKGSYKINAGDHSFTLTAINDACDGRAQAIAGRRWMEATKK